MSQWEDHEVYVTNQVRQWFQVNHPLQLSEWRAAIARENRESGNDPADSREDNVDWLAGEMEDFAVRQLVDPMPLGIIRRLMSDALSEADWENLAGEIVNEGGENGTDENAAR